jgi:hypothetical protein
MQLRITTDKRIHELCTASFPADSCSAPFTCAHPADGLPLAAGHGRGHHHQHPADGASRNVTLPSGSTVTQALQSAGVAFGDLDRVEPPPYAVLDNGDSVSLTRVRGGI